MNAERNTYLGGTDVAAICGKSDWKTSLDVYLEKTGQIQKTTFTEAMYWGQQIEPLIIAEWAKRSNGVVLFQGLQAIHPLENWRGGTVDGIGHIDGRNILLEAKKIAQSQRSYWESGGIPTDYLYQIQHYLDVHELEDGICCVLFGGSEYVEFPVQADRSIQSEIREEAKRFWHEHVLAKIPPSPKVSTTQAGEAFELTEDKEIDQYMHELFDLREAAGKLEVRMDFLEKMIKDRSNGRRVTYQGQELGSWSTVNRREQLLPAKTYTQFRFKPINTLAKILGKQLEAKQE